MNLITLDQSLRDRGFLIRNAELEFEVLADVLKEAAGLPYIGSLFKIGRIFLNYQEFRFFKKIAMFLKESSEIPEDQKQKFYDSLSSKDRNKISSYLLHFLSSVEEDEKAVIMAYIYKARMYDKITDNNMMLRLCSIVSKAFVADLKSLGNYIEENECESIEANNFVNLGLINNFIGGVWKDGPSLVLNDIGKLLFQILESEGWFNKD